MDAAKEIFKKHQAQTFPTPSCLEIKSAKGSYITDVEGKQYLDFVAGVSACTLGHSNSIITNAVKKQLNKYSHVMVYGEYVQNPQYKLAELLAKNLPTSLNTTYFTNSGTEAIEGAMKLAKRATGRSEIISCKNSYHGSTQGSLSIMGNERKKANYRPLLPSCNQIHFNDDSTLANITNKTAAVVIEPIQGASGFISPENNFLLNVKKKCAETGTLLIFDEIQTCYGRLGTLFGFECYNVIPDILCLAKGMGAGMPIGAFISSNKLMNLLTFEPSLGHITTFGGHPVNCAASLACLEHLISTEIINDIEEKERLFRANLIHSKIKEIRGKGLMLAIELDDESLVRKVVDKSLEKGLILFYFLFTDTAIRITPPLTISDNDIIKGCKIIKSILDE
ncbi:MAG: aspartate aminotransferase family protein [Flavobacteriales bacterium]|nr:aspartate aminotransferase family protein [Flavobacteriales bacterium]|tara:strand:- start:11049 stop:12230 length:1182 start_codon:yes stop_codon:yes gene_type:complete